jgi:hypothetical protein
MEHPNIIVTKAASAGDRPTHTFRYIEDVSQDAYGFKIENMQDAHEGQSASILDALEAASSKEESGDHQPAGGVNHPMSGP